MKVLAIDLGTKCGWCVAEGDSFIAGTWNLAGGRFDGGGMRFLRFEQFLREALPGVERVAYEEVRRHMGVDAAHVYGGLQAVLTAECERQGIPYEGIPVATIKKHATGKGNAKKDAMMNAARQRWSGFNGDDNEADARWIAATVLAQSNITPINRKAAS